MLLRYMESDHLCIWILYRRLFIIRAAVVIFVLFRDLHFGGAASAIISLTDAHAVIAVTAAPSSLVHFSWTVMPAVNSLFAILVLLSYCFKGPSATDSMKFVKKAII